MTTKTAKIYKSVTDNQIIIFDNQAPENLPRIDEMVDNALCKLDFLNFDGDLTDKRLKLVMRHGSMPQEAKEAQFNYPVVCLRMSSQGFLGLRPKIDIQRIKDVREPNYFVQGGKNSARMPSTSEEWVYLINWLLSIEYNNEVPIPDDQNFRKFIYTEPYPEELLSYYLVSVAKGKDVTVELDEAITRIAEEDFNILYKKHFNTTASISKLDELRSLFHKISTESAK